MWKLPAVVEKGWQVMTVRTSPQKAPPRTPCPCGERLTNTGSDLCNVCRVKGLPFCPFCGVRVGRRNKRCDGCQAEQRIAGRQIRDISRHGAYSIPCPECGKGMHCVEDFKICQWCGYNVLLVDGSWL